MDAQLGYEFKTGKLKNLSFMLQVYNLTNEEYRTYQQIKDRLVEYQKYGKTYLIGANYKF